MDVLIQYLSRKSNHIQQRHETRQDSSCNLFLHCVLAHIDEYGLLSIMRQEAKLEGCTCFINRPYLYILI